MTLRLLAGYSDARAVAWDPTAHRLAHRGIPRLPAGTPRWFGKRDRQERPVSASSVETHYRRLKTFFHWLVERNHAADNPLDLIEHPRFEEQMLDLLEPVDPRHTRTEAERFRAFRNRAIIWLLIDTPIRRKELGRLRVDDVDLDAAMVKVMGKGRRERWMPLGETSLLAVWNYLRVRVSRLPHLWVDEHGHPQCCRILRWPWCGAFR